MQTIDDAHVLEAWDRMRPLPRPWREVALLSAITAQAPDDIAALPIGDRDRRLLDLRERVLGRRLECRAACPACAGELEWTLDTAVLRLPPSPAASTLTLEDGLTAVCRAPDSRDLAACVRVDDPESALLARCVALTARDATPREPTTLSEQARARVQHHLAALDPEAEMQMALTCPDCGHAWTVTFDPAAFVLEEIDTLAARVVEEVHTLASAYGWSEADILRMPRARRQRYLDLVLG